MRNDDFNFQELNQKQTELDILEDYIVMGLGRIAALIPRDAPESYIQGVRAAAVSTQLSISLAYALKRYVPENSEPSIPETYQHFQDIYVAGKVHMDATVSRFKPVRTDPSAGEVYSDVALRRLKATYFSAGLLFRTGHLFEARAIVRLFLEQVAWAYSVFPMTDAETAIRVSPTQSISNLKKLLPKAGSLYGELSKETHIGLETHPRFLDLTSDVSQVRITHGKESWMSGVVLLDLADFWSVIFERTQLKYIASPENWDIQNNECRLKTDRPFVSIAQDLRKHIMASDSSI